MILFFAILTLCIIIESSLITFPFTLIITFLTATIWEERGELLAFVAGLILDLFTLRFLGIDSLFFLILVFLWKYYRKRIYPGSILYRLIFLILAASIYSFLFYREINFMKLVLVAVFGTFILFFVNRVFPRVWEKGKLSV
jgi:cell shape-determining protein MreD